MKVSKLIEALKNVKELHGDVEILVSSDEEGNAYGELGNAMLNIAKVGRKIVIFPVSSVYLD